MMSEEIARAFTIRLMSHDQIAILREKESKLKRPTECLSASQIAKEFRLDRHIELDVKETEAMERCWADFYKTILGPQQAWEETLHPAGCTMFTCYHPWDKRCKTKAQEMWQWEDYVLTNYKPPQIDRRGVAESLMAAALVLITVWK